MKSKILFLTLILTYFAIYIFSETLWDDRAGNIYSQQINYQAGESIKIFIEEDNVINYKASTQALKNYTIDINGGELSALFSFLPQGKAQESKNIQDKDEVKIKTSLVGQIVEVTENGVIINGAKTVTLNNKTSQIQISGQVYFSQIKNNSVYSSDIMNLNVQITTLLENNRDVIAAADLETVITNPDATSDQQEETRLTEDKKQQLLLQYFNKILNLVF